MQSIWSLSAVVYIYFASDSPSPHVVAIQYLCMRCVSGHTQLQGFYYCCFVLLHEENLKVSRPRSILHA